MHSAAGRRPRPVPPLTNHTPRRFEVRQAANLQLSQTLFASTQSTWCPIALAPVTEDPQTIEHDLFIGGTNCGGQGNPTYDQHDNSEEPPIMPETFRLSPILSEDFRDDSDKMMTRTNLLVLPPTNPSYHMSYFLRTTGPMADEPDKSISSKKAPSGRLRLFRGRNKESPRPLATAHERYGPSTALVRRSADGSRLNNAINADTRSVSGPSPTEVHLPDSVQQKLSKDGIIHTTT